jgi:hypothetical protein
MIYYTRERVLIYIILFECACVCVSMCVYVCVSIGPDYNVGEQGDNKYNIIYRMCVK